MLLNTRYHFAICLCLALMITGCSGVPSQPTPPRYLKYRTTGLLTAPVPATNVAPSATTGTTPDAAIRSVDSQAATAMSTMQSPYLAKGTLPAKVDSANSANNNWQIAAIVIPAITPFAAGGTVLVRAVAAALGAGVGYEATKGSPFTEAQQCLAVENQVAAITAFKGNREAIFSADKTQGRQFVQDTEWADFNSDATNLLKNSTALGSACM